MNTFYDRLIIFFLFFLFIGNSQRVLAQNPFGAMESIELEFEEYKNITLPPLDVLFENAKNAPSYELALVQEEIERKLLKKEKKSFLSFFSLRGSWQYGNFTNDASYNDIVTDYFGSYSKSEQTSFSVGAGLNIPLDQLFDLGGRVKRQKLMLRAAELQKEKEHELVKKEIVELYTKAISQLNILKLRAEAVVLADSQYSIVEQHFINGTVTSDVLASEKEKQSISWQRYEDSKFDLNKSLMILEVITQTPIIKK